nr:hypothetical protein [Tanacetum cinerariifolium]
MLLHSMAGPVTCVSNRKGGLSSRRRLVLEGQFATTLLKRVRLWHGYLNESSSRDVLYTCVFARRDHKGES